MDNFVYEVPCEAPVTLREIIMDLGPNIFFHGFYAVVKVEDTIGIYNLHSVEEETITVQPLVVLDSRGNNMNKYSIPIRPYTLRYEDRKFQKMVFVKFDLATVKKVLLSRGCDPKLVSNLVLDDLDSAKKELKSPLLETYLRYSADLLIGYSSGHSDSEGVIRKQLGKMK